MSDTTDAGAASETDTATGTTTDSADGFDPAPWRGLAEETGLSPEQVKRRLEHARTWEARAKENKQAATQAQTLEQQVAELQQAMSARDAADAERATKLALTQVKAVLAERGIKAEDAAVLLEHVDPTRLLAGGDVDDKAVAKLAESLSKIAGRPTPDPDQGRTGNSPPASMNDLIRRAVRP
jgi:hypothetical protein